MDARPLGIWDSGLGGLTVVRAVAERLPAERLVYFGDTARVPYGTKGAETVRRFARQNSRFLMEKDIKALVVACNTASALALDALAAELPVPVLGVIEPGAEAAAAATRSG
ncbi:aspartate/glutamate racemase family protein, partial [bacterium]|nr:aspartate/glutamate racemase family protein [bacterium]